MVYSTHFIRSALFEKIKHADFYCGGDFFGRMHDSIAGVITDG